MPSTPLKEDLLTELERLGPAERERVAAFVHSLGKGATKGTPGKDLLRFSGVLDEESAREMTEAIEQGCEGIGADAW